MMPHMSLTFGGRERGQGLRGDFSLTVDEHDDYMRSMSMMAV